MPAKKRNKKISSEDFRAKLKLKHLETKKVFQEKYPHVDKFFADRNFDLGTVREHSAKIIGTGAVASALLLNSPSTDDLLPKTRSVLAKLGETTVAPELAQQKLVSEMNSILPETVRPLSQSEEKSLEKVFSQVLGVPAKATLEGEHLNTTFGRIGAEQHLRRYPGDTNEKHGTGVILKEGMAPGLGAWGYFANSAKDMNFDLEQKEKWYAVVQTLYLPDWNTRQPYLKNWYKYRKVLMVNTDNGNAVVASIADSGPAAWTGKHYGGSPEVMMHLGGPRYKKGPVIVFFVDDPENKIPLGPVEYNKLNLPALAMSQT